MEELDTLAIHCDVRVESINRYLKYMIQSMGSNMKSKYRKSFGCSLGIISKFVVDLKRRLMLTRTKITTHSQYLEGPYH